MAEARRLPPKVKSLSIDARLRLGSLAFLISYLLSMLGVFPPASAVWEAIQNPGAWVKWQIEHPSLKLIFGIFVVFCLLHVYLDIDGTVEDARAENHGLPHIGSPAQVLIVGDTMVSTWLLGASNTRCRSPLASALPREMHEMILQEFRAQFDYRSKFQLRRFYAPETWGVSNNRFHVTPKINPQFWGQICSSCEMAAYDGDLTGLKVLCRARAAESSPANWTTLEAFGAAMGGHLDCCKFLKHVGCNMQQRDAHGQSPACVAELSGFPELGEWLRQNGGKVKTVRI